MPTLHLPRAILFAPRLSVLRSLALAGLLLAGARALRAQDPNAYPVFTLTPAGSAARPGTNVTLTATSNFTPVRCEWMRNFQVLSNTTPTLTFSPLSVWHAGFYHVTLWKDDHTAYANDFAFEVIGDTPVAGDRAWVLPERMSVTIGSHDYTLLYLRAARAPDASDTIQWYRDGVAMPGETGPTLDLDRVTETGSGVFHATLNDFVSSNAYVTFVARREGSPTITRQPLDVTVQVGGTAVFEVGVGGPVPMEYSWYKDNAPLLAGSGSTRLTLNNVTAADAGLYALRVSNGAGVVRSSPARLNVVDVPGAGTYSGASYPDVRSRFLAVVNRDNQGLLLARLDADQTALVAPFRVQLDGSFEAIASVYPLQEVLPVKPRARLLRGRVGGGRFQATVDGLGQSLEGGWGGDAGLYAPWTGGYVASLSSSRLLYTIVTADGSVFGVDTGAPAVVFDGCGSGSGIYFDITAANGDRIESWWIPGQRDPQGYLYPSGNSTRTSFTSVPIGETLRTKLSNVSTRGYTGNGDDVMIAGFVVSGNSGQPLLIRGLGPALERYGVRGVLADPSIAVFSGDRSFLSNDNWTEAQGIADATATAGAQPLTSASRDAALAHTISCGSYTVQARGSAVATGIVLLEVYDAGTAGSGLETHLSNVSTRGRVGLGDEQLIVGFIVAGEAPKRLLIRAVGPTLRDFSVSGCLTDPRIELHDATHVIASNDNWDNATDVTAATAKLGIFKLAAGSRDSALLATLAPGAYTVVVSGAAGTTGVALAEVYEIND